MKNVYERFIVHNDKTNIIGFNNELKALYMNFYLNNTGKNVLYVVNSLFEANKMYQSLMNYNNNVLLFPMDDFLTSEALAISPELKTTRLETINTIVNNEEPRVVVTNLEGFLRFLPTKKTYLDSIIRLEQNKDIDMHVFVDKLLSIGYQKESMVSKTGEIAVRGFVVDIFPVSFKNPIRIEFWGDTIDSIREFDVNTQLTINNLMSTIIYPSSEFLVNEVIDNFNVRQKDLCNYGEPSSIIEYLDNSVIFYDNYDQIKINFEHLEKEMFEYSVSNDLSSSTKYMHHIYKFENAHCLYFSNFDSVISKSEVINKYNVQELDSIKGDISNFDSILKSHILKND